MSSNIVLNPKTRRDNKARFNSKNPWAQGKTLAEVKALVDSGEHTLKGGFEFPAPTKGRKSRKTKGGSPKGAGRPTTVATKRSKAERRAAEAKKAERQAQRSAFVEKVHARKRFNADAAEWMRSEGLQPRGRAWEAVKAGERDVAVLAKLNAKDGLKPVKAKATKKAAATKGSKKGKKAKVTAAVVADVDTTQPAARPHRANGSFMSKVEADEYHRFIAAGLTVEQARTAVATVVA